MNSTSTMPPRSCLPSKQRGLVGVAVAHTRAHFEHVGAQLLRVSWLHQDTAPLGSKRSPMTRPRRIARTRQRLCSPTAHAPWPSVVALVAGERFERRNHQPGVAVGPQPQSISNSFPEDVCVQPGLNRARATSTPRSPAALLRQTKNTSRSTRSPALCRRACRIQSLQKRYVTVPPRHARHAYSITIASVDRKRRQIIGEALDC